MTLTAGSVIDQARGRHAGFDVSRHPNKVVLQFLSAYQRQLHGKITAIDPEAVRADLVVALPLASFDAGIPLGSSRMVAQITAVDPQGRGSPVDLIPATAQFDRNVRVASAWQIGATLFLHPPAEAWQRMASLKVAIAAVPSPLATLADPLVVPDAAELACVEACASFMARRAPVDAEGGAPNPALMAAGAEAETSFLKDIANRLTGLVIQTRDVYDPMGSPGFYRL